MKYMREEVDFEAAVKFNKYLMVVNQTAISLSILAAASAATIKKTRFLSKTH